MSSLSTIVSLPGWNAQPPVRGAPGLAVVDLGHRDRDCASISQSRPRDGMRGRPATRRRRTARAGCGRAPDRAAEDVEVQAVVVADAAALEPGDRAARPSGGRRREPGGPQRGQGERGLDGVRVPAPVLVLERARAASACARRSGRRSIRGGGPSAPQSPRSRRDDHVDLPAHHQDPGVEAALHEADRRAGSGSAASAGRAARAGRPGRRAPGRRRRGRPRRATRRRPASRPASRRTHARGRSSVLAGSSPGAHDVQRRPRAGRRAQVAVRRRRVGGERPVVALLRAQPAARVGGVRRVEPPDVVERDHDLRGRHRAHVAGRVPRPVGRCVRHRTAAALSSAACTARASVVGVVARRASLGASSDGAPVLAAR